MSSTLFLFRLEDRLLYDDMKQFGSFFSLLGCSVHNEQTNKNEENLPRESHLCGVALFTNNTIITKGEERTDRQTRKRKICLTNLIFHSEEWREMGLSNLCAIFPARRLKRPFKCSEAQKTEITNPVTIHNNKVWCPRPSNKIQRTKVWCPRASNKLKPFESAILTKML